MMKPARKFTNRCILTLISGVQFTDTMDSVYALARFLYGKDIPGKRFALNGWRQFNHARLIANFPDHGMRIHEMKQIETKDEFVAKHKDWLATERDVYPIAKMKGGRVMTIVMTDDGPQVVGMEI